MWNNSLRELWNLMLRIKWNEINPLTISRHFTLHSNISHAKRISQIPQGIYFVEKDLCFVSKHRSFSGGGCEIRTHGGFDPITGFQDQLHKPLGQTSALGAIFHFLRNVVRIAMPQKHYNSQSATAATAILIWGSKMQSRFQDRAGVTTSVALHTGAS